MKFLAIFTIAALAFAAGWVTHERKQSGDQEPKNNDEDQSNNLFV